MSRTGIIGAFCGVLLLLSAEFTAGAYITDKLLAGFYASPDLTSEPIRALPNGTPMEVLEEQGKFSRIRLGDNSEGWVETRFVTQEKPVKMMLLELQAKYAELKRLVDGNSDSRQIETPVITAPIAGPAGKSEIIPEQQNGSMRREDGEAGEGADQQQPHQQTAPLRKRLLQNPSLVSGKLETDTQLRTDNFQPWLLPLSLLGLLLSFIGGIAFKNYRIARRARQLGKQ
ncbi:MAG: SH3 domain-containing protein [Gammaproteobacteria bacterium]|nr:SH3 domain-containing protein [Gammaproteobacteria bacterium]